MKLLVYISLLLPLVIHGQDKVKLDESFDPTTLHDWPGSKARIEQIKSLKAYYASIGDEIDSVQITEYSSFVFRVQLGSTSDYDEAIALEAQAAQTFEEEVMVQFDSPYYKIRVGTMNNREDAQNLQQFAIENGYRRAWVIRTENTPELEN
ncbi:MAG: SPOR domain-containing protein [Candidatus Marinimicrobia bacterium]|nr:SPOR domain-containing protein [Candidatus Neomarinimicrobiota bacterium]MCF7921913.1 SPOR domain-containing protein [Candidatus Neomarinimicrobiota bacterium]